MKAKNSLMAMLWPLISALFKLKNRLFDNIDAGKSKINPLSLELQKVSAESKRIAEKLQETQQLKGNQKPEYQCPGVLPLPENKPLEPDEEDEELVLSRWREDEDDRSRASDYEFWNYRQNLLRADHPDIMEGNLLALFKADHDAAQFEQYQLENARIPPESETLAVSQLRRFLSGGLNFLLVFIFIIGAGSVKVKAQQSSAPGALKPGDMVPDVTIQNMINYPATTAKISGFKGKLLVLDFWSTWCKGCLESFEHADELKKQVGDRLQILFITSQQPAEISKFLSKNTRIAGFKSAMASGDVVLKKMFPYVTVPHLVWISPEGKFIQTTEAYDLTAPNIQKLLDKQQVAFKAEKTDQLDFDGSKPLFDGGNGGTAAYQYRSMITGFQKGLPGSIGVRKDSTSIRLHALNQGMIGMYKKALQLPPYWPDNRILFEGLDRSVIEINNWYEEREAKAWCYELILPLEREQDLYPMMHQDLCRYFKVRGSLEERKVSCLVLENFNRKLNPPPSRGERYNNLGAGVGQQHYLKNDWLVTLIEHLNGQPGMLPIVDESKVNYTLNLELGKDLSNLASLNEALKPYGLNLKPEERTMKVMILAPAKSIETINSQF